MNHDAETIGWARKEIERLRTEVKRLKTQNERFYMTLRKLRLLPINAGTDSLECYAGAVRAISAGAMASGMIGKSVSNALMQGLEVANGLSPIIQEVFPSSEGILKQGLGHANAANELLNRGINIAGQVEQVVAPIVSALGPVDAPIIVQPQGTPVSALQEEPTGAGLDTAQVSADDMMKDDTGPRFVS